MTGIVTADKEPVAFWEQARDFLLGVPLQILAILVAALIAQVVLSWLIRRVVRRATERAANGVSIPDETWRQINELAGKLNVSLAGL